MPKPGERAPKKRKRQRAAASKRQRERAEREEYRRWRVATRRIAKVKDNVDTALTARRRRGWSLEAILEERLAPDVDLDDLVDECSGMLPALAMDLYRERLQQLAGLTRNPDEDRRRSLWSWAHGMRARRWGGIDILTDREWFAVIDAFAGRCAYCGKPCDPVTMDHVIPLRHGGDHAVWNVVPACGPCNVSKHTASVELWCARSGRSYQSFQERFHDARARLVRILGAEAMSPRYGGW